MSTYPYWQLSFEMREDLEPHVRRLLEAVARDEQPQATDLDQLPPGVRWYLQDWRRMLDEEGEPVAGSPVRLWRSRSDRLGLSIEFSQHDDQFANRGWVFWLWILNLCCRLPPTEADGEVIGVHGMYRNDGDSQLVHLSSAGITEGSHLVTFDDIEAGLAEVS